MDAQQIAQKIQNGKGSIKDVYKYADKAGEQAMKSIIQQIKDEHPNLQFTESEAYKIVSPILKEMHEQISRLMVIVINQMYKDAGTGLKAIMPEYNPYREIDVVNELMAWSQEGAENE